MLFRAASSPTPQATGPSNIGSASRADRLPGIESDTRPVGPDRHDLPVAPQDELGAALEDFAAVLDDEDPVASLWEVLEVYAVDPEWVRIYGRKFIAVYGGNHDDAVLALPDILEALHSYMRQPLTLERAVAWLAVPSVAGISNMNVLGHVINSWERRNQPDGHVFQAAGITFRDYLNGQTNLAAARQRAHLRGYPTQPDNSTTPDDNPPAKQDQTPAREANEDVATSHADSDTAQGFTASNPRAAHSLSARRAT